MNYKARVVAPDGLETVSVLVDASDNLGCGIAVAEIIKSQPHKHLHTRETYVLLSGTLAVTMTCERGSPYRVLTQPGDTVDIPLDTVHFAEALGHEPARILVTTIPPWSPDDHLPA